MAKSDFQSKAELQDYLNGLREIDAQYKKLNAEAKKLADVPGGAKQQVQQQLRDLRIQSDSHKEILASIKLATKELNDFETAQARVSKTQQKNADDLKKRVNDLNNDSEEYLDLQYDISKSFGKTTDHAKMLQAALQKTKTIS